MDKQWDNEDVSSLAEPPLHTEVREENQRAQKRQQDFRLAATYVARELARISVIERVALFGSVAQ